MSPELLCRVAANCFGRGDCHYPPRARSGGDPRPHWPNDEAGQRPPTDQEVSDGSLYHTPASVPDPSVATAATTPTRTGPRRHPLRGHRPTGPSGGGRHVEADPLHPLADLLGLLLANPQPRSPLPRRVEADRGLDGTTRSDDRRRGDQSVLQGPRAATGIRPPPPDAIP